MDVPDSVELAVKDDPDNQLKIQRAIDRVRLCLIFSPWDEK